MDNLLLLVDVASKFPQNMANVSDSETVGESFSNTLNSNVEGMKDSFLENTEMEIEFPISNGSRSIGKRRYSSILSMIGPIHPSPLLTPSSFKRHAHDIFHSVIPQSQPYSGVQTAATSSDTIQKSFDTTNFENSIQSESNSPLCCRFINANPDNIRSRMPRQMKEDVFKAIVANFNLNDQNFEKYLNSLAKRDVIVSLTGLKKQLVGIPFLLIFWQLVLEGYPDGVINHVKSRELAADVYEYSFTFIGTRITAHSVVSLFSMVIENQAVGSAVSPTRLLDLVTRSSHECTQTSICPLITCTGRSVLTYDELGQICEWISDIQI